MKADPRLFAGSILQGIATRESGGIAHTTHRLVRVRLEVPIRITGLDPVTSRCSYPSVRRSNPTYEASGTMFPIWQPHAGKGLGEDGKVERKRRTYIKTREG